MKKRNLVYKIVLFIILLLPISNVAQTKNPEGDDTSESTIFISDEPESSVNYHGRYKITAENKKVPTIDPLVLTKGLKDNKVIHYQNTTDLQKMFFSFISEEEVNTILSDIDFNFYCLKDTKPVVVITSGYEQGREEAPIVESLKEMEKQGSKENTFVIWMHITQKLKEGVEEKEIIDYDEDIDHSAKIDIVVKILTPKNYSQKFLEVINN